MPKKISDRRKALAIGSVAHAIQDGLGAATYVLLPILAQTFGFGYAQVGIFRGAMSLVQGLLEMSSGILSERIGTGRSLVFGLILAGLGFASIAGFDQANLLLICLLVVGMGSAFQHAPASALVSTAFETGGQRGALGLYNSSGDVGKLVFAGGFSLAIGTGINWQQVALSYGLVAIIAAFAMGLMLPTLPLSRAPSANSTKNQRKNQRKGFYDPSNWGVIDPRSFATLLIVISLDSMVQAGVLVFVAFAMISKGLPLFVATMASVVVLTGGILGKAGCGYLSQWLGVRRAFILIQLVTVAGLLLVIVTPAWVALGILFPLGVVSQGSSSITYGLIPDLIKAERLARGYALMYSLTSFAAALGPFSFGFIADQFGISAAFFAMAILTLVSAIPMYFFPAGN